MKDLTGKLAAPKSQKIELDSEEGTRLNKYVSNAGICARRKADEFIRKGDVTVNGQIILEMGHKVMPGDEVHFQGQLVEASQKVYVLLNKPKDCITTTHDPQGRKTVMDYLTKVDCERLYPVGRLDRMTTGLLLLTNDGQLAQNLAHPSREVKKLYHVKLNKTVSEADLLQIRAGKVRLEEGLVPVDEANYVKNGDFKEVGISIHIGWNRVIRRIFEELGYRVEKLDRVIYAGLTKKDLPRSRWRYLEGEELLFLKRQAKK